MEGELERLENEKVSLEVKIMSSDDYFLIYGWARRLEEVEKRIGQLKSIVKIKDI
jgi:hypothetical protein